MPSLSSSAAARSESEGEAPSGASQRIGVGGGDESVVRAQLAARWAEAFAPEHGDTLGSALQRFRHAYEYLDAVMHGIEPAASAQHDAYGSSSVPADVAAAG